MEEAKYTYNVYKILRDKKAQEALKRAAMRTSKRGRPRKYPLVPADPEYVSKLSLLLGNEITSLVCSNIVNPEYIQDWSKFSDMDKARIIVKHPKFFTQFRAPFLSRISTAAATYLISKDAQLFSRIHIIDKFSVREWEYILKRQPQLIEDCPCRDQLSMDTWIYVILNYDMAYRLFKKWGILDNNQRRLIIEKNPKLLKNKLIMDNLSA